jgi:hypothetical protein
MVYLQRVESEENNTITIFLNNSKWEENWFDLRLIDFPQIGIFYDLKDNENILYRMSLPVAFPLFAITPIHVTYASSYWGVNILLFDITFGSSLSDKDLEAGREMYRKNYEKINKKPYTGNISDLDAKLELCKNNVFTYTHLFRIIPFSIWAGIPLASNGMGLYLLFEPAPICWFKSAVDKVNKYEEFIFGIGLNTGLKFILSKHIEFELKYENYFSYNNFIRHNEYIGLTFKFRIGEPGYYGIWW